MTSITCAVLAASAVRNFVANDVPPGTATGLALLALAALNLYAAHARAGRSWLARVQHKRRAFEAERRGAA